MPPSLGRAVREQIRPATLHACQAEARRIRRIRQPRYCHHGAVRRLRQVDIALNRDRDGV